MNRTIDLEFITPLFSHGATDKPEVRAASIRGHLHDWFRLLGGDIVAERRVFGGIKQSKASFAGHEKTCASSVVVRVGDVVGSIKDMATLPHKSGGMSAPRQAFDIGTKCRITVIDRLCGLSPEDENCLDAAINAWLLMGTLGYRATRAAGSFLWQDEAFEQPTDRLEYEDACRNLLEDFSARAKVAVLEKSYERAEDARRDVSDSLGGRDDRSGKDELKNLHDPLGCIVGGRKTSPFKYRIVRLGKGFHILALWDNRRDVTGNAENDFYGIIDLLERKKPKLGSQLKKAFG